MIAVAEETRRADEVLFVDRVLEGWASWAHDDGIDLRPTCAGDLWKVQVIIKASTGILRMSDDAFVLIDQRIAGLPRRLRRAIFVEYTNQGTSTEKARFMGLNRIAYRERLTAAQWSLYAALMPQIETWRTGR